jgi:hypothetical protein
MNVIQTEADLAQRPVGHLGWRAVFDGLVFTSGYLEAQYGCSKEHTKEDAPDSA